MSNKPELTEEEKQKVEDVSKGKYEEIKEEKPKGLCGFCGNETNVVKINVECPNCNYKGSKDVQMDLKKFLSRLPEQKEMAFHPKDIKQDQPKGTMIDLDFVAEIFIKLDNDGYLKEMDKEFDDWFQFLYGLSPELCTAIEQLRKV